MSPKERGETIRRFSKASVSPRGGSRVAVAPSLLERMGLIMCGAEGEGQRGVR